MGLVLDCFRKPWNGCVTGIDNPDEKLVKPPLREIADYGRNTFIIVLKEPIYEMRNACRIDELVLSLHRDPPFLLNKSSFEICQRYYCLGIAGD